MSGTALPIRLPGTLRGDKALREFSEDVSRAIMELRDRQTPAPGRQTFTSPYCPLTPHFLREDGADWLVQWRPGYVYELYPATSGAGPVTEFPIFIGATALDNATTPDLDISLGDFIYLHFETTDQGAMKEISAGISAEIVALGAAQDSTYHVLPDGAGSSGTDGDYFILLGEVDTLDGLATISKNGWRGNFFWHAGWNALENVGSGEKIYRDYDISGDKKRLRTLVERASDHQINLSQVGDDEIRVEGNNKTASLRFEDCSGAELYTLSWVDGLITNAADGTIQIPPCEYNATAETYFTAVEDNDSFTFSNDQKSAISDLFNTLDTASITAKVVGMHFVGSNAAAGLRNAMAPATVYAGWDGYGPDPSIFSTGYASIDGETGSYNRTPGELGMSNTSAGGFITITGAPRTAMTMMNSYNSSSQNFQIKQDTGELCIRNAFSSVAKGSNEEQNGVFVGTRNGSGAGAVTCVNVTGGGGGGKTSSTLTYSRSGGSTATNDISIFDASCDFDISIMGQTTGLTQAEAETLASALYDCAVAIGHTAIAST